MSRTSLGMLRPHRSGKSGVDRVVATSTAPGCVVRNNTLIQRAAAEVGRCLERRSSNDVTFDRLCHTMVQWNACATSGCTHGQSNWNMIGYEQWASYMYQVIGSAVVLACSYVMTSQKGRVILCVEILTICNISEWGYFTRLTPVRYVSSVPVHKKDL